MTLLNRYILRSCLRVFFLALATFIGIYLLVDFFEKVDDFIEHQAGVSLYLAYFLNKIPLILTQVAPLGMLMAVFMTIGGFSRTNELTAIRAGGVSLWRVASPLLGFALLCALALMAVGEYLVPVSTQIANHTLRTKVKGQPALETRRDNLWFRDGQSIINIRLADPEKQTLQGVSILHLDEDFHLEQRTDAARAAFDDGQWHFEEIVIRSFAPESGLLTDLTHHRRKVLPLSKTPEDFTVPRQKNEEFGFFQLAALARDLEAEGYDAKHFRVDMHSRLATPFACLIMAFLGIPFALQKGRGASLAMGITISVAIGMSYFIVQAMLLAFGYSGVLPPLVAAWSANVLFGLLGTWLMLTVHE